MKIENFACIRFFIYIISYYKQGTDGQREAGGILFTLILMLFSKVTSIKSDMLEITKVCAAAAKMKSHKIIIINQMDAW